MIRCLDLLYFGLLSKLQTWPDHSLPSSKTCPPKFIATSMGRHRFLDISATEMPRTNLLMSIKGCVKSRHFKKLTRCLPLPPLPSERMDLTFLRRKLLAQLKPSMCRSTAKTSHYQSMHALLGSRGRAEDIHPVSPAPPSPWLSENQTWVCTRHGILTKGYRH